MMTTRPATHPRRLALVGWVVDAQNDFLLKERPGGRLFVRHLHDPNDPGAEQILPALSKAVTLFHRLCAQITYSGDWHHDDDPEIDRITPDLMKGTYPPHCMGMSDDPVECAGAMLVSEVRPPHPPIVLHRGVSAADARKVALDSLDTGRAVFIEKNQFSVFAGGSHVDEYLATLGAALDAELVIVVCGVATDVCVKHAVNGFLARDYRVILLTDAIYGLGLEDTNELVAEWQWRGLVALSTDALESMSNCSCAVNRNALLGACQRKSTRSGARSMGQRMSDDSLVVEIASLARRFAMRVVEEDVAEDISQDIALQCLIPIRAGAWCVDAAALPDVVRRMVRRKVEARTRRSQARALREAEYARLTLASPTWMSPELAHEESEATELQDDDVGSRLDVAQPTPSSPHVTGSRKSRPEPATRDFSTPAKRFSRARRPVGAH